MAYEPRQSTDQENAKVADKLQEWQDMIRSGQIIVDYARFETGVPDEEGNITLRVFMDFRLAAKPVRSVRVY